MKRVVIYHNDENGEKLYAVAKAGDVEDWLDAFPTVEMALDYCSRAGHEVVGKYCTFSECNCQLKEA